MGACHSFGKTTSKIEGKKKEVEILPDGQQLNHLLNIENIKARDGADTLYSLLSHLFPCSLHEAEEIYLSGFKEKCGSCFAGQKIWSSILGLRLSLPSLFPLICSLFLISFYSECRLDRGL